MIVGPKKDPDDEEIMVRLDMMLVAMAAMYH